MRDADVVEVVERVQHVGHHAGSLLLSERGELEDAVQNLANGDTVIHG